MKDKRKLAPLLRAFKNGYVDYDYAMDFILHVFSTSKRFNYNSFMTGFFVGIAIAVIIFNCIL